MARSKKRLMSWTWKGNSPQTSKGTFREKMRPALPKLRREKSTFYWKKKLIDLTQIQKLIPPPKIIPKTVNFPLETCWNIPFCHTYESCSFLSQFVIFPPQHLKKPFTLLSLKSSQPQFCPGNINTSSREKFNYEY